MRYLRIAPRKVRLVAELIRGKKVSEAQTILRFCTKSAANPLQKMLHSALASFTSNVQLDETNLYIANVAVQEGSKLKRYRPRARGRAYPIQKKTSHITLVLSEVVPTTKESKKEKATVLKTGVEAREEQQARAEKPKFRPMKEIAKPKVERGFERIFRRKAV